MRSQSFPQIGHLLPERERNTNNFTSEEMAIQLHIGLKVRDLLRQI
jgi:hypothetical protein